jgi:hypothetical protein
MHEWELTMLGQNPWAYPDGGLTPNSYGPLFNILAPLWKLHFLLPKLLFCACWFSLSYWFFGLCRGKKSGYFLGWILFLSPFFWIEIPLYGHFDILVAAAVVLSVHCLRQGKEIKSGALLGLGVLIKFIPIVILPFLAFEKGVFKHRFFFSCMAAILIGFLISFAVWGSSTFAPITFSIERESKLTSIFMFLSGRYSPLRLFYEKPNLDFLSVPAVAIFLLTSFIFHIRNHWDALASSLFALLGVLLLYKVGHPQFQTIAFILLAYYFVENFQNFVNSQSLRLSSIAYFIWYNIYQISYYLSDGLNREPGLGLRHFGGLLTFVLGLWFLWSLCKLQPAEHFN